VKIFHWLPRAYLCVKQCDNLQKSRDLRGHCPSPRDVSCPGLRVLSCLHPALIRLSASHTTLDIYTVNNAGDSGLPWGILLSLPLFPVSFALATVADAEAVGVMLAWKESDTVVLGGQGVI